MAMMGLFVRRNAIASSTDNPARPRYDLVAIDLDGTLLRSDKQASVYDAVAITEAIRRGVNVVIATARPPRSSREVHKKFGLKTPLINYNGALIHDPKQGRDLQHKPLSPEVARGIVDIARELEPDIIVDIEVLDKAYTDREDPAFRTETGKRFKPDYVGPLDEVLSQPVTKVMLLAEMYQLEPIRKAILKRFSGRVGMMLSDGHIMQAVNPAVNKAYALAWIAGRYGVSAERVCAIGDAPNDAAMLRWAGLGLATANAFGTAIDHADIVLEHTNDDWAVGRAIEKYVLEDDPIARKVAANRVSV